VQIKSLKREEGEVEDKERRKELRRRSKRCVKVGENSELRVQGKGGKRVEEKEKRRKDEV